MKGESYIGGKLQTLILLALLATLAYFFPIIGPIIVFLKQAHYRRTRALKESPREWRLQAVIMVRHFAAEAGNSAPLRQLG